LEKHEEIDKFVDTYDHPKLNQENINHPNRSIACNDIGVAIKSLPKNISSVPDGFSDEFYQTLKEEQVPTLPKLFHKIQREGTLPKSFYEASVTLIPKIGQGHTHKRELQTNLLNKH
jgi:hypothetical protein